MKGLEVQQGITYQDFKGAFDRFNQVIREVGAQNQVLVVDLAREIPQENRIHVRRGPLHAGGFPAGGPEDCRRSDAAGGFFEEAAGGQLVVKWHRPLACDIHRLEACATKIQRRNF